MEKRLRWLYFWVPVVMGGLDLAACDTFHLGALSWVPPCIFAFVGSHALGQGVVIWVFVAEVFHPTVRASGQTLGSATY